MAPMRNGNANTALTPARPAPSMNAGQRSTDDVTGLVQVTHQDRRAGLHRIDARALAESELKVLDPRGYRHRSRRPHRGCLLPSPSRRQHL